MKPVVIRTYVAYTTRPQDRYRRPNRPFDGGKLALFAPRNSAEYRVALPWNPDMACAGVCGYARQGPSRENQGTEEHGCATSGGSCFWFEDVTFFVPEPRECFGAFDWLQDSYVNSFF